MVPAYSARAKRIVASDTLFCTSFFVSLTFRVTSKKKVGR